LPLSADGSNSSPTGDKIVGTPSDADRNTCGPGTVPATTNVVLVAGKVRISLRIFVLRFFAFTDSVDLLSLLRSPFAQPSKNSPSP
jgi:hypothetical protein